MTRLIGRQLGNYRLMRLLGAGGSAEVYLGEHIHLKRQAAIKVLHPMLKNEQKEDFLIEAQRLVDLSHPSIVPILDFALEGDLPYLIMEYAPNGTLRTRHPAGSRLSLATVVSYVNCIAAPLQYLHEQKLIHRDVKPENLLVGKNQEILLSDLGIAAIVHKTSSLSMQGLAGTPAYMPPEQSEGIPRAASDQYALGIVAYEWLCGRLPFQGSSLMGLAVQHLYTPPPSLCQQIPTLPPAVEQVILKALAKKPQQRFRTITEFAEALEEASLTTESVAAVSRPQQKRVPSSLPDTPTHLPTEPVQMQYAPGREVMPPRSTQSLALLPQHVGWAQDHVPAENDVVSRPVAVRNRPTAYQSRKPYSSPTAKAAALRKRKGLSYIIGALPLIVLVLGASIAGFTHYFSSLAAVRSPAPSPSPVHQTPTAQPTQQNALATDTFQRPNQGQWGTATDGQAWSVDAVAQPYFSIKDSTGKIAGGQKQLEALIGSSTDNVEVTVTGSINQFVLADQCKDSVNLGVMLRWTDPNNWYKACFDGQHLAILRDVGRQISTIQKQIDVPTQPGTLQRLRFRSVGSTLLAKVWSGTTEPDWMIVVDDHTFSKGWFGIRVIEQPATVILITGFSAAKAYGVEDV